MSDQSNSEQIRIVAEQVADTAITRFVSQHPEVRRSSVVAEIPPPLKWAAIIASAVLTVSASAGLIWMVTSVSDMSVTLARMDERMGGYISAQEARMAEQERRITSLEGYHREGGR
tara:strand:- start:900 stop:1247 length:348 start_codon:yes stop_codon:yes gene_type:complete